MSLLEVLLFFHLASAFLLIGGITSFRVGLQLMRSASHGAEALGAYRLYGAAQRLTAPSAAVMVVTGLVLTWRGGYSWTALWILGTVVLSVAVELWRAVLVIPLIKRLDATARLAAADPAAHGEALLAAARHPRLHLGHLGLELTNTVILALMVFKPASLWG